VRVRRVRAVLGLVAPPAFRGRLRLGALVCAPLLLGLAAAQPALRTRISVPVRADTAVFVVVDTSTSMEARAHASAPSRLDQAKGVALAVGGALPGIPVGVANLTDRVLPNLFATVDGAAFASTVRSLAADDPPPRETQRIATTFGVLASLRSGDFFTRAQTHRAVLLVTDGESRPFDAAALARSLGTRPAIHLFVVRVGGGSDRLFAANGRPGGSYRADPAGASRALAQLAAGANDPTSSSANGVAGEIRRALGSGPTSRGEKEPSTRRLAPFAALAGLLAVLVLLTVPAAGGARRPLRRS
jgi:hypothetical protein